jgi:hypothetical protein
VIEKEAERRDGGDRPGFEGMDVSKEAKKEPNTQTCRESTCTLEEGRVFSRRSGQWDGVQQVVAKVEPDREAGGTIASTNIVCTYDGTTSEVQPSNR